MMKKLFTVVIAAASFSFAPLAMAGENFASPVAIPGSLQEDLTVKLYTARWQRSLADVDRQRGVVVQKKSYWQRRQAQAAKNFVSKDEVALAKKDWLVSELVLEDRMLAAEEARILLGIAIDRLTIGLKMPICADIRSGLL